MNQKLGISIGHCSDSGIKPGNQDFHGSRVPTDAMRGAKGIAVALADGISSSDVSQIASQTAVQSFLDDYYATSEAWTVKSAALRVLQATNSWLYSQSRNGPHRYNLDKGYVCTFSALVIKSATAHLFHVGDARVYRVADSSLEQLTEDHRLWASSEKSYLARALGMREQLDIDYSSFAVDAGDTFVLATDGVYEFSSEKFVTKTIADYAQDLDQAARLIVADALARGSDDNLTIQIVRVDQLPPKDAVELQQTARILPFPPTLVARMSFDGYALLRQLHSSGRSQVFLARDEQSGEQVVIKVPATSVRGDQAFLDNFLTEEWIARKIDSPHVLKAPQQTRPRQFLYSVMEYVEGQTLAQWMIDHPTPDLETVRTIIEQVAKGLRAMHRQEMLHQDLRPANILIDQTGTVKIIDFGSTFVAGMAEAGDVATPASFPGTVQYSAPEYFVGEALGVYSDLFSLGVIAYQMLSGRFPYGAEIAKCRTRNELNRLRYQSVLDEKRAIPVWIDDALKKAVQLNPYKRYDALSEFIQDLRHPGKSYLSQRRAPLIERHPVRFWQTTSLGLAALCIYLLVRLNA